MSCGNKSCAIKSDNERLLSCWLCDDLCHIKCAGIVARVADCLNEDRGIRWCCTKCRKIEVSFYRFYKSMQTEFSEMERDLSVLTYRFSKFSKMFSEYPDLEKCVNTSPKSSPKRKKASKKAVPALIIPTSPCLMQVNSPINVSNRAASNVDVGIIDPIMPTVVVNASQLAPANLTVPQQPSIGVTSDNIGIVDCSLPSSSGRQPRELTVIPARKTIFISRFSPETSVEDINFYISSRVQNMQSISCYKLKSSFSERLSSFKIVVPDNLFEDIVDLNFWPAKALVKEFVYRDNDRRYNLASLPKSSKSAAKN